MNRQSSRDCFRKKKKKGQKVKDTNEATVRSRTKCDINPLSNSECTYAAWFSSVLS
jgi:hypothetical protein